MAIAGVFIAAAALVFERANRFASFDTIGQDIYFLWIDGARLVAGENPYARVLDGNMRDNDKYSTYLPGFYLLSAMTQALGWRDFVEWVHAWRYVFLMCHLGVAWLVFTECRRRGLDMLGLFGALFYLFNRWTLHVLRIAHIDFIPILLLVWSLVQFDRRRRAALLLFGLSLSFKHVGVLLLPMYLVWVWRSGGGLQRAREVVRALLVIASVPALLSLPFLVWNAEGFVSSILFSVTRNADAFSPPSIDASLRVSGGPARLGLLVLLSLIFGVAARGAIGRFATALLTMAVFLGFNPALFSQYMSWIVPFVPLAVAEGARTGVVGTLDRPSDKA